MLRDLSGKEDERLAETRRAVFVGKVSWKYRQDRFLDEMDGKENERRRVDRFLKEEERDGTRKEVLGHRTMINIRKE
jgi:hypothetical protein